MFFEFVAFIGFIGLVGFTGFIGFDRLLGVFHPLLSATLQPSYHPRTLIFYTLSLFLSTRFTGGRGST